MKKVTNWEKYFRMCVFIAILTIDNAVLKIFAGNIKQSVSFIIYAVVLAVLSFTCYKRMKKDEEELIKEIEERENKQSKQEQ